MLCIDYSAFALGNEGHLTQTPNDISVTGSRVDQYGLSISGRIFPPVRGLAHWLLSEKVPPAEPTLKIKLISVLAIRMNSYMLETGHGSQKMHRERHHHGTF
jgi:hypothetical protein